jgi:hypothetical protein
VNPDSPGNPKRARARKARKAPSYEPEFLRIWDATGKRGNKFKAQESWVLAERPALETVRVKWAEYEASLESWQSPQHLVTWINQWGFTQDYRPAKRQPERKRIDPAVRAREEAEDAALERRAELAFGRRP